MNRACPDRIQRITIDACPTGSSRERSSRRASRVLSSRSGHFSMSKTQVGFIGTGQMARALARGFVASQCLPADAIWGADCLESSRAAFAREIPGSHVGPANREVIRACSCVFLAVKPQSMSEVLAELRGECNQILLVSIAAGVSTRQIVDASGSSRVIRVMPNMACLVGQGASGFCRGPGATDDDSILVARLLQTVGKCWELPESQLHAVTGLSGSGPAFVFQFIEALSDGGVLAGLPRSVATALAAQTVYGAAQSVLQTGEHPAELKDRVASPAGTTIAGLRELEQGALRGTVINAVQAATTRSRQLELDAKPS